MKRACVLHDQVNLLLLPVLGGLTAAGLFGLVDPVKVTVLFTAYILADLVWLVAQPDAVPSLPNVIIAHHVVTFVLLCFPLAYPALAVFTCWVRCHALVCGAACTECVSQSVVLLR